MSKTYQKEILERQRNYAKKTGSNVLQFYYVHDL